MATALAGVVDDNTLLSNRRVVDMDPTIKILEPDAAPFTQLAMNAKSRPAKSQKVEWIEDELLPRQTTFTATVTNVATSFPVAANTALRAALTALAAKAGMRFVAPPLALCTDNAVMIAWAGIERFRLGLTDPLDAKARPRWPLDPNAAPARGAGVKA